MKKLLIILACVLLASAACTKSKEVHPEIGDGNDEVVTVGMKDVHVKYLRTDHAELSRVLFHYSLAEEQQFEAAEMTKREDFFELTLNDLVSDTLYNYYYELFPKGGSAVVTDRKTFHTQAFVAPEPPTPPSGAPEGAINGLFTINANGDQVYFSQGNLQYQASTNTWRFAENQWNYVGTQTPGELSEHGGGNVEGSDNIDVSEFYDGWIDIFNWGTSGYNHGANYFHPWDIGGEIWNYHPYGCNYCNLYDNNGQADWGYNAIFNGGNAENQWRTLTKEEWNYVINERSTESGICYAKANVNGVNGLILLPDDWHGSVYDLNNVNQPDASYVDNVISELDWVETLQYNGVVFLPAAGHRQLYNDDIDFVGTSGCYWSSTIGSYTKAYFVSFYEAGLNAVCDWEFWFSSSVRLVQDATP